MGVSSGEETDSSFENLASLQRKLRDTNHADLKTEIKEDENKLSRWRKCHKEKWKRNVNKENLSHCKEYSTKKNKLMAAKIPKNITCNNDNCKFKCSMHFSEEDRVVICREYWGLKTYERKKDFILKNVEAKSPESRRPRKGLENKERKNEKKYFFSKTKKKLGYVRRFS